MAILSVGLLLASFLCCSFSQAPGDGDPLCINETIDGSPNTYLNYSSRPVYPATVWPLMDSRDYVTLLLGKDAVWQQVDQDTNNTPEIAGTNWFQLSSIPCQGNVLVCGFSAGPQENWLITQHISRQLNSRQMFEQISVKIVYNLAACNINRHCKQSFDLYKWETSTINSVAARRTENYIKIGTYTPMTNSSETVLVNETMDVVFTTEESGVYLALVDEGTCVVIHRLFVFYEGVVCPDHTNDLINRPPILAPQDMAMGRCVANSSTLNGLAPLLHCTDEGLWEIVVPCLCNAGYESKTIEGVTLSCSECPVGTFSDTLSNNPCQPCPANSEATQTGLIECPCHQNYYRAATEKSSIACTQSPSAPLSVSVSDVTNTSVLLSWLPPEDGGGRNLSEIFYMVRVSGSIVMTIKVNTTFYTVMGLTPGVQYTFSVTAGNAVSSQDSNINARTASVTATTSRGVPSRVLDVQEHCTVVVWKQPANINGLVTNYFVTFSRGQDTRVVQTDAAYHYYVVQPEDIPPGTLSVTVEVRAQNEAGLGERGHLVSIDCLTLTTPEPSPSCPPPITCPTCSPLPSPPTCPICPNCSDVTTPPPVACPTCPPSPTCPPNVTCSTDPPTVCPDCETCPTSIPPTSCPECPNVTCPTCSPLINCSTPPPCPNQTCPTCPLPPPCPTPTCPTCPLPPPCPTCQPCEACPTSPTTLVPVTCPKCEGCPAEEVQIPGLVTNVHISNCNQLLWDLPDYGGKCISEYRVRIFSGRTYGSSKEKRVFRSSRRNLTLTWLPQNGTASIIVRAKNNVGFSSLWSFPIFLSPGGLSCAQDANDGM